MLIQCQRKPRPEINGVWSVECGSDALLHVGSQTEPKVSTFCGVFVQGYLLLSSRGCFHDPPHQVHDNELRCAPVALPLHRRQGGPACLPNHRPCHRVHSTRRSLSMSCQRRPRAGWFVSPLGPPPSCRRAIDVMCDLDLVPLVAVHSS